MNDRHNWAKNHSYRARGLHIPSSTAELREIVGRCKKVKALGTRHAFNHIADCEHGDQVSLERFDAIKIDREQSTVTIGAGVQYGELGRRLHASGYAVNNLASLPDISVAGACATATHGSGDHNGNLATAVCGMEIVDGEGELKHFSRERDGETFDGMVVNLGALGVVAKLILKIVPAFLLRQDLYEGLTSDAVEHHFDAIMSHAYSVSLFTDWKSDLINQVWVKSVVTDASSRAAQPELFGAKLATRKLHPIPDAAADHCTEQLGVPGPSHERLPHFCSGKTPSSGEELQSEFFVPRASAVAALRAVMMLRDRISPLLHISEIRTVAADNLWMSPAFGKPIVGIHFTWKKNWLAVSALLPVIEAKLKPFHARPHWAKLFTMSPADVRASYPKLEEFRQLAQTFDPQRKFQNAFLDRYIFANA